MTNTTASQPSEQELFETWADQEGYALEIKPSTHGDFHSALTQHARVGWIAGRAPLLARIAELTQSLKLQTEANAELRALLATAPADKDANYG